MPSGLPRRRPGPGRRNRSSGCRSRFSHPSDAKAPDHTPDVDFLPEAESVRGCAPAAGGQSRRDVSESCGTGRFFAGNGLRISFEEKHCRTRGRSLDLPPSQLTGTPCKRKRPGANPRPGRFRCAEASAGHPSPRRCPFRVGVLPDTRPAVFPLHRPFAGALCSSGSPRM